MEPEKNQSLLGDLRRRYADHHAITSAFEAGPSKKGPHWLRIFRHPDELDPRDIKVFDWTGSGEILQGFSLSPAGDTLIVFYQTKLFVYDLSGDSSKPHSLVPLPIDPTMPLIKSQSARVLWISDRFFGLWLANDYFNGLFHGRSRLYLVREERASTIISDDDSCVISSWTADEIWRSQLRYPGVFNKHDCALSRFQNDPELLIYEDEWWTKRTYVTAVKPLDFIGFPIPIPS